STTTPPARPVNVGQATWSRRGSVTAADASASASTSAEVGRGDWPLLHQHHPVAGVVTRDGLDAVRPLLRRLDELHAFRAQVVVGLAAVVDPQAEAEEPTLVERPVHRLDHVRGDGRAGKSSDGPGSPAGSGESTPPRAWRGP